MTLQVQRAFFVLVAIGLNFAYCEEINDSTESVTKGTLVGDKSQNSTSYDKLSSHKSLEPKEDSASEQSGRKQHKREQGTLVYSQSYPYLKEAPYPTDDNQTPLSLSTGQEINYRKEVVGPLITSKSQSVPLVASDIEIRRAVPFENDYISRQYASKFNYLPPSLGSKPSKLTPRVVSNTFLNSPKSNDEVLLRNENLDRWPRFSLAGTYPTLVQRFGAQPSQFFFPNPFFSPSAATELNRFRNPSVTPQVDPTQTFVPGSPVNLDNSRAVDTPGFVSWIPPGFEQLQQYSPLDRFAPGKFVSAQPPSTGFNVEVSEIGEPAFIVPEEAGKVDVTIPPPFAPSRTHGLSINDAQIIRNEVRKDNGEFVSSYTTSDGTARVDSGELIPTAGGDQVLVLKGSYSFTTPEGLRFRVNYSADETGYHAIQVPVSEGDNSS